MEWFEVLGLIAGSGAATVTITRLFDRQLTKARVEQAASISELNEAQEDKVGADAAAVIANTAMTLVAPLQSQVAGLAERVAMLETENALTTRKLAIALAYIQELLMWITDHVPEDDVPRAPVELGI